MARLAVVLYGKLALETQRPHDGVRTSPATVGLSATTWAEAMLAPLGEPIDVFGHCWNPEAAGLLRELWPSLTLPVVCEADVSARMEAACQRRARTAELGRVGCFFPRTCGRTMSHLLGIQRALRLKSAHELRRGRRYRAVLLCRWDVVWWSPRASAWLRGLLRGGNLQLDRFWLPSMCAQEASPGGASRRRVEASFKRAVCGVPSSISIPTLTSSASTQAVDFRGSHWSAMPDARASFFPDWWFVSSSELADGFATIFDLFFNITKVIVHELHRPFVLNRTVNMSSGWRGLYLFGHWYWALHIMQHLRAEVKWAPLEIPREFTLVRHVPSGVENCLPTSAQVTFGANASTVRGYFTRLPLQLPDAFNSTTPRFKLLQKDRFSNSSLLAPTVHSCRVNPAFGWGTSSSGRSFVCPISSEACAGTESLRPGSIARRAMQFYNLSSRTGVLSELCPKVLALAKDSKRRATRWDAKPCAAAILQLWLSTA